SSSTPGGGRNATGFIFFPEGVLPEADKRPSCAQVWPPLAAPADAKPVGRWSIAVRSDGLRQWALDGYPLYTSVLDRIPGKVNGGPNSLPGYTKNQNYSRIPVGPPADMPPGFAVGSSPAGRLLVTSTQAVVFVSEHDAQNVSHCDATCAKTWRPMLA